MKKGVNNKKTNNVKLGHIAIVETKHLILRTAENYLDKKMCKNFFLIQRTFCSNIPYWPVVNQYFAQHSPRLHAHCFPLCTHLAYWWSMETIKVKTNQRQKIQQVINDINCLSIGRMISFVERNAILQISTYFKFLGEFITAKRQLLNQVKL